MPVTVPPEIVPAGMPELPGEGHTARAHDQALGALRLQVLEMGGLVIQQVSAAVRALLEADAAAASQVLEREREVNAYDTRIDHAAMSVIALHQPVAGDLRTVRALTRSTIDLERAGDEAKKIAYFALDVSRGRRPAPPMEVRRSLRVMSQVAAGMLRDAVVALDRMDAAAAVSVRQRDSELDTEFDAGLRVLVTHVMGDSRGMASLADTVLALKGLERIGDHAKNIAEQVVFIVLGHDLRHTG